MIQFRFSALGFLKDPQQKVASKNKKAVPEVRGMSLEVRASEKPETGWWKTT